MWITLLLLSRSKSEVLRQCSVGCLMCSLNSQRNEWATQPVPLIGMLIEHEGKGSLLSYLKAKGWADSTCAGEGDAAT